MSRTGPVRGLSVPGRPAHVLLEQVRYLRGHPAHRASTLLRFAAWVLRCGLRRGADVRLPTYGCVVHCPARLRGTGKLLYSLGEGYEPELLLLRRWVRAGDCAVDVGAHLGVYTAALASVVGPQGHVTALEPWPDGLASIDRTLRRNGFLDRVTVVPAAASDRQGEAAFSVRSDPARSSLVCDGTSRVATVRLDDVVTRRPVRFVKVDVEGAEPQVLAGAQALLRDDRPVLQLELTPDASRSMGLDLDGMLEQLARLGYRLHEVVDGQLRALDRVPTSGITNVIALPPGIA